MAIAKALQDTHVVTMAIKVPDPLAAYPLQQMGAKLNHTIEIDSENAVIAKRIFELYASGNYSLAAKLYTGSGSPSLFPLGTHDH